MSSPDRPTRRLLALGAAVLLAGALGGCFRPMYAAPSMGGTNLTARLAEIDIPPIEGRIAQVVRNNLRFGLTGGAGPSPTPRYLLDIKVSSSQSNSIVNAITSEPEVDAIVLIADFTLRDATTGAVLMRERNYARKSFDRTLQRFAAVRAARDAENGAAEVIAEAIKNRLAIYFSSQPG